MPDRDLFIKPALTKKFAIVMGYKFN